MKGKKSVEVSFLEDRKESIQDRLRQLFNGRSLRQTALDWDLPYSTLNNYFEKGATPGLNVVKNISLKENVSLDWLVFGKDMENVVPKQPDNTVKEKNTTMEHAWKYIYESLDYEVVDSLIKLIHRKGAEALVSTNQSVHEQDIEDAINSLPIRDTLKQAIRVALPGDEAMDKEILRRISNDERSVEPETGIVQVVNKNTG
ncbi:XRE family transcriptional regulator [Xenorhabdus nematophila]|uniref:XRE family transcriptional regulator n=1 Tax=Xenorhabdus nematophila TaxID=628 RepID=UPI0032B76FD7